MSEQVSNAEKISIKDYSHFGLKKLNKILKLRNRQIERAEKHGEDRVGNFTNKSLAQLKYERDAILSAIMERTVLNEDVK